MAGLYVHIPFCHSKCIYCDFYSVADRRRRDEVVEAIGREFSLRRHEVGDGTFGTVYIGGGTPSVLPDSSFIRLVSLLPVGDAVEFTMEVNPEDVSAERVRLWRAAGVNRISMGIQSFSDAELRAVGRRHSAEKALNAVDAIRSGGIDNLSCDLIYGLPGQTFDSWKESLSKLLSLELPHFSAYSLSYEPGTALYRRMERGLVTPASEDLSAMMYEHLCEQAAKYGYEHYEISNFARPGLKSRHNSSYWENVPYLGLGPGAHSYGSDGLRRVNPSDIQLYLGSEPAFTVEEESDEEKVNDCIITGLRTSSGLVLDRIEERFHGRIMQAAKPYLQSGKLIEKGGALVIPERHWLVADAIMRDLLIV